MSGSEASPKLAVLYAAKSSPDEKGSIDGQLEEAREWAEEHGHRIIGEYHEEDVTAYMGDRGPELAKALEHAESTGATLVAQHSDRLARGDGKQARHLVEIALWAMKADAEVHCVQDPTTFENLVMAAVMGERNMQDSRRKSHAVRAGRARRRKRGQFTGRAPNGYRYRRNAKDERELVPDPKRAWIIEAHLCRVSGRAGPRGNCRATNGRGDQDPPRRSLEPDHGARNPDEPGLCGPSARRRGVDHRDARADHRPQDVGAGPSAAEGKGTHL